MTNTLEPLGITAGLISIGFFVGMAVQRHRSRSAAPADPPPPLSTV